jgi:hypothetical protein
VEHELVKNNAFGCRWSCLDSPLPAARYYTGKSSTCHTERRNTEREVGQVAFMAVLADVGRGGKSEQILTDDIKWRGFLFLFLFDVCFHGIHTCIIRFKSAKSTHVQYTCTNKNH